MNTDVTKIRALVTSKLIAIVAACSILAACDDGPTAPTVQAVPTPVPISNVAGTWQGRYDPGRGNQYFQCGPEVAATATFTQDGAQVAGTVRTQSSRLGEGGFTGQITGAQLRGTLTVDGTARRVTGEASANRVTMNWSVLFCGDNTIDLRR